ELGGSNVETNPSPPFCAQLWLVAERTFFATAARGQLPAFRPVRNATRGHQFFAAILFANCAPDPRGAASVNYDVTVRRPDGTLYGQSKSLVGCQGPLVARPTAANSSPSLSAAESPPPVATPAAAPALQLGRDYLGILLGDNDPVGVYTVEALVRDRIGDTELALKTTFTVL
ncbi:MAG: hypothetical protein JO295_07460, partial [Verrucomicrobia bacterium]|nr:hypothetical protein [Verrucomicrobiota bacterium]